VYGAFSVIEIIAGGFVMNVGAVLVMAKYKM
jgi:hypothetical protein